MMKEGGEEGGPEMRGFASGQSRTAAMKELE